MRILLRCTSRRKISFCLVGVTASKKRSPGSCQGCFSRSAGTERVRSPRPRRWIRKRLLPVPACHGRAREATFDEDVRPLLDVLEHVFGEPRP